MTLTLSSYLNVQNKYTFFIFPIENSQSRIFLLFCHKVCYQFRFQNLRVKNAVENNLKQREGKAEKSRSQKSQKQKNSLMQKGGERKSCNSTRKCSTKILSLRDRATISKIITSLRLFEPSAGERRRVRNCATWRRFLGQVRAERQFS